MVISNLFRPVYLFLLNKWYFDELYDVLFVRSSKALGKILWKIGDTLIVDGGGPNGFAKISQYVGGTLNRLQSGYVYSYAFVMLLGVIGFIGWFISMYVR